MPCAPALPMEFSHAYSIMILRFDGRMARGYPYFQLAGASARYLAERAYRSSSIPHRQQGHLAPNRSGPSSFSLCTLLHRPAWTKADNRRDDGNPPTELEIGEFEHGAPIRRRTQRGPGFNCQRICSRRTIQVSPTVMNAAGERAGFQNSCSWRTTMIAVPRRLQRRLFLGAPESEPQIVNTI